MATEKPAKDQTNPPTLVAIAMAARQTGDRDLERSAIRELKERHGVKVSFCRGGRGANR